VKRNVENDLVNIEWRMPPALRSITANSRDCVPASLSAWPLPNAAAVIAPLTKEFAKWLGKHRRSLK
jgi:hypothetical protein